MLSLRYPYVWLALGWLLVIGVIVGSLLPASIIREITPAVNDKIEHFSAYFVLMMWFGGLYPRAKHLSVAGALLFLGIALDVLQGVATTTRTFDLFDIAGRRGRHHGRAGAVFLAARGLVSEARALHHTQRLTAR